MEHTNTLIPLMPRSKKDRTPGKKYLYKGEIRIWDGNIPRCEHNRPRSACKECGGGSICEHNRKRSVCKECGGGSICEHNRKRYRCKECGGASICEHNRVRYTCRKCNGGAFCKHDIRKWLCKECGGASLCKHGKPKVACAECDGIMFCDHGRGLNKKKRKDHCNICRPKGSHFCEICHFVRGTQRFVSKENKYVKMCADCFYNGPGLNEKLIPTRYKRKQHYIHEKLKEKYGEDFFHYDKTIECGCSKKIPDWFRDCFKFVLNLECDENQHKKNDISCENKRLMQLFLDCANRPFICLRFNPDKYINKNGEKVEGCFSFDEKNNLIVDAQEFERRWNILEERINYFLEYGGHKEIELEKLFYDGFD